MSDIHSAEYKLGQRIRYYRKLKGWSQTDLSRAVDIDRADISKYENGERGEMGFKMLKRFAKALGVSTDQLMDDEDECSPPDRAAVHQEKFERLTVENQTIIEKMTDALLLQQVVAS